MGNKGRLIIMSLLLIGIFIFYFYIVEEPPPEYTIDPPAEGTIKEYTWIDNNKILLNLVDREEEGQIKTRIFELDPFSEESREIISARGWRLDVEILDIATDRGVFALKKGDEIQVIDFSGEIIYQIEEAGINAQAQFSPDNNYLAYTFYAEWEMPTDAQVMNLDTGEKDEFTSYQFGQEYKTGAIGWGPAGDFFFVEEFAFGTLTLGGPRLYSAEPGAEKKLLWEVPGEEQLIGFNWLEDGQFIAFFVEWDDEAMNSQLFVGRFDIENNEKKWVLDLDKMGDRELWQEGDIGYPDCGQFLQDQLLITRIDDNDKFNILVLDLQEGKILEIMEQAGFPRISPGKKWLAYRNFSGEKPALKVIPLTAPDNMR